MRTIKAGGWRADTDGPMQVVSGPVGREKVHYEAPPASRVPEEMKKFLRWFAKPGDVDPLLLPALPSAVRHDRPVRGRQRPHRPRDRGHDARARSKPVGVSTACQPDPAGAHRVLRHARGRRRARPISRDGKPGFSNAYARDRRRAPHVVCRANKGTLLGTIWRAPLNERQIKVLNRLLDGFEGKLSSSKWAKLTKSCRTRPPRHLELVERGALRKNGSGCRSTSHPLITDG